MQIDAPIADRTPPTRPVPAFSPSAEVERALTALLDELGAPHVVARRWVRGPLGTVALVVVTEREAAAVPAADATSDAASREALELRARARGLTRRESQVAAALARRRSNEEIAAALGISRHTARHHTERVLAKLGITRRNDVAAALRADAEGGEP